MSTALVIVDGALVPFVEIDGLLQKEMQTTIQECTLTDAGILNSAQSGIGKVLYCLSTPLSMQQLTQLFKMLSPGAEVLFHSVDQMDVLRRNCIFSGFLVVEDASKKQVVHPKECALCGICDVQRMLKVRKPEWEIGAKSEVKSQPPSKWTVDVDEDELLDDNDFLTEDDLKPPPLLAGGKAPVKKACDNCTCGRAEGKEPVKLTQEMIDNPVTNCGSCGLGDAYRCASCPYRGLPSFEPGKKIELPEGFLVSDL